MDKADAGNVKKGAYSSGWALFQPQNICLVSSIFPRNRVWNRWLKGLKIGCFKLSFNQVVGGSNPPCLIPLKALNYRALRGFLFSELVFDFLHFRTFSDIKMWKQVWKLFRNLNIDLIFQRLPGCHPYRRVYICQP